MHRLLAMLAVVILASGCSSNTDQPASQGSTAFPTATATASSGPQLHLVAIGDSIAASTLCACPRYPEIYGKLASTALGQTVLVQNLAKSGTTSFDWLDSLDSSRELQDRIKDADIITVTIGINDLGPCGSGMDEACYGKAIGQLKTNLETLLSKIDDLQASHAHILRQTAYYNLVIGSASAAQLGPSYLAFYAEQLKALNATICDAVAAHKGLCVELIEAFNGPAGDHDAADLLVSDHVHPSRTGMQIIANQIAAKGYAPLQP